LGDIAKEIEKLAIINPILNALFPNSAQRPTLDSVGTAAAGGVVKAAGAGVGGDASTGSGGSSSSGGSSGSFGSALQHGLPGLGGWLGGQIRGLFPDAPGTLGDSALTTGAGGSGADLVTSEAGSAAASGGIDAGAWDTGASMIDAGTFHGGGLVGEAASFISRAMPASVFDTAPRYHTGLNSDEFAAVLQKGERVLTANQNNRATGAMQGLAANGGRGSPSPQIHMNISTPDANSFQASSSQIYRKASVAMNTARGRTG
jgi:hypothetical protein